MNPKTFETIKKGSSIYIWNAIKQIAGYGMIHRNLDQLFVVPINNETGEAYWREISTEERELGLKAITKAIDAFYADQKYDPREMYKQGKCMRKEDILQEKVSKKVALVGKKE